MLTVEVVDENATENLKWLCSTKKSVSQICREIGLNRQQFARYLSGNSTPSPHTWRRICEHFSLDLTDMALPVAQFRERFARRSEGGSSALGEIGAMLGLNLSELRSFAGFYQTYYISPSWPGDIICALTELAERDGYMNVRAHEHIEDGRAEIRQDVNYTGFASMSRNRLMVMEMSLNDKQPIMTETILEPPQMFQKGYLRGISLGVSWRAGHIPFCTPSIWHSLGPAPDMDKALVNCGRTRSDSSSLPFAVREFFESSPNTFTIPDWD